MGIEKEKCHWFVLTDQRLDNLPILDVIKQIERIAKRVIPDTVYTHHWGDLNKDHRICCEAVITALRPKTQKINKNKTKILCFEINGNMGILPPKAVNKFRPDHYVDITGSKDQKTKAMEAYQSELQDYPGIFSSINMLLLAKKRAKKHNYKYAEAFEQICFGDE
jgi:LmbE family N-acetylglucosaminyl deacetylase